MSIDKLKGKRPTGQYERKEGDFRQVEVREINDVIDQINRDFPPRAYKVYTALLTQDDTSPPDPVVLENTIGTVTWEYDMDGRYLGVTDGLLTIGKTVIFTGQNYKFAGTEATYAYPSNDGSSVVIETLDSTGNVDNGNLKDTFVEIRVYK